MDKTIRLIHNNDIDLQRWDRQIENAGNSRIYALSWYLDILHPDWHGLVYGDYSYLMPLVFSRKWGFGYAYQPLFAQQHGIYPSPPPEIAQRFTTFLKDRFRFFELSFNSGNTIEDPDLSVTPFCNYLLPLAPGYTDLKRRFTTNCIRNIRRGREQNTVHTFISPDEYLKFKQRFGKKTPSIDAETALKKILHHAGERNACSLYGAYSKQNELTGAAVFLHHSQRYTYLNSVSSPEGMENRSMFALIDTFIQTHAGEDSLLDFEGSNIDGIARFFAGFGAQPETYPHVRLNRLPWPLTLFKK